MTNQVICTDQSGFGVPVGKEFYYPKYDNNSPKSCYFLGTRFFVQYKGVYRETDQVFWDVPEEEQAF